MNVVDSSAWLEYFADGANARHFAQAVEDRVSLLVPSIVVYEVFKRLFLTSGENKALLAAAQMKQGRVIRIDEDLAIQAALLSCRYKLPMADSLILACARQENATVWTQDEHFLDIPGVRFFPTREKP